MVLRLVALILAAWPADSMGDEIRRGIYYRNRHLNFEMWIPRGFTRCEKPSEPLTIAEFSGGSRGATRICFCNQRIKNQHAFTFRIDSVVEKQLHGARREPVDGFMANGRPAPVIVVHLLELPSSTFECNFIYFGLDTGKHLVWANMHVPEGRIKPALAELRWMMGTFRSYGPAGLDSYLSGQQIHEGTGLTYRPPMNFDGKSGSADPNLVFWGTRPDRRDLIVIAVAGAGSLEGVLRAQAGTDVPDQEPWVFPHPIRWKALGSFFAPKGKGARSGRALAAVLLDDGSVLTVSVRGDRAARERLVRIAELVVMSLDVVDMEAIRERVAGVVRALTDASRRGDRSEILKQLDVLSEHLYLREARTAMARSIWKIKSNKAQKKAIRALARSGRTDVKPFLFNALKRRDIQKRLGIVSALLEALSLFGDVETLTILSKYARHGHPHVAAAAIRGFGNFSRFKNLALRKLISVMKKEERQGMRKTDDARERWSELKPVYREALEKLTGIPLKSSKEAMKWLKGRK